MNPDAEKAIKNHALYAAGGGLIPIPVLDFMAVTGVQIDLVQNLCDIYNLNFYRNQGKSVISAFVGTSLASIGSSLIKAIPGIGSLVGGFSMSILSGATTYAIGQVFAKHFENGGTMDNLDVEEFRAFYKRKVEEGKSIVKEMKEQEEQQKNTSSTTSNPRQSKLQEKLEDVKRLYESGIITKSEYEEMRKRLFENYIG
jgi:uncharacterized protein (DUF697 family)